MIELQLIHDGNWWIAKNESLFARAKTLVDLDREVALQLRELDSIGSNEGNLEIRMTFDRSAFPQWIRQYSGHYFNRVVTMDLRE